MRTIFYTVGILVAYTLVKDFQILTYLVSSFILCELIQINENTKTK